MPSQNQDNKWCQHTESLGGRKHVFTHQVAAESFGRAEEIRSLDGRLYDCTLRHLYSPSLLLLAHVHSVPELEPCCHLCRDSDIR
jgi:hypothetical protein